MTEELRPYSPHFNMTTINKPYEISGTPSMQGPAELVVSEYLKCTDPIIGNTDEL